MLDEKALALPPTINRGSILRVIAAVMVRLRPLGLLLILGCVACFNPTYASPGYFCHPDDNPACPDGQTCSAGRCVDKSASLTPIDLSSDASESGDGSSQSDAGSKDMSHVNDLTKSCQPKGGDCTFHDDSACCSNYCVYSTNKCK